MKVLAISGSLRADSYNTALARAAAELAPPAVDVELYEGLAEIPLYDADRDGEHTPVAVRELRERIASADALFVVTPEYNGSVSGVLKNAIDWASRPAGPDSVLWGKTAAIAGATTGQYGAIWAQQDLRRILGIAGARVIDGEVPVARAQNVFDRSGRLLDPLVTEHLRDHLVALAHDVAPVLAAA
jgi:chromate reductase, NAD(P)H dehydrogenase (quinone)